MSTGIGSWELQKAIVTALRAKDTLTALLASLRPTATDTGIYDDVPEGAVFPYIVVGEGEETEQATFGADGHMMLAPVECWTQDGEATTATTGAAGYKQALAIAALVVETIMDDGITVTNHDVCVLRVDAVEKQRNDDQPPYLRVAIPKFAILLEDSTVPSDPVDGPDTVVVLDGGSL